MFRSLALLALAGCYDNPAVVIHVTRASASLDGDIQTCEGSGSACDPSPYLEGEARVFGGGATALKRDVSIFDEHGGTLRVRYADTFDTAKLCVDIALTGHALDRTLMLDTAGPSWGGPETADTTCGPK